MKQIQIFTDGSCLGNPGPGGYAAILKYGPCEKEVFGGFSNTTNSGIEFDGKSHEIIQVKEKEE